MALRDLKSYSAPPRRRKMQITMTVKFRFSPVGLANIEEFDNIKKWLSANWYNFHRKKFVNICQNVNANAFDLAVLLVALHPRYIFSNVRSDPCKRLLIEALLVVAKFSGHSASPLIGLVG